MAKKEKKKEKIVLPKEGLKYAPDDRILTAEGWKRRYQIWVYE